MMNYLLGTAKDAKKRAGYLRLCFYCHKVFNNPRALGGHLRAHQAEIKARKIRNNTICPSNSIDLSCAIFNIVPFYYPQSAFGAVGNNLTFYHIANPPDISGRFRSNETNQMNVSKLFDKNHGNNTPQFIVAPNLSSESSSSVSYPSISLYSTASAASGSSGATDFPLDPLLRSGKKGVCQFNTQEYRSCRYGMLLSSGDAFLNYQSHNPSRLSNPAFTVAHPSPVLGSKWASGFKKYVASGSSVSSSTISPGQSQSV